MNITPEQIPDEVVEAAARAVERRDNPHWSDEEFEIWWNRDPLFCERRTSWSGYTQMTRKEVALVQARTALAAALPVLLVQEGYRIDWHDATYRGKQTISSTPCSAEDGRSTPLYSIRTPETPNAHP
ncbi:hypothetical protein M8R20_46145 [Pseudomonas sp. R2.Fl]|nr:hypothetical protein [Pseudomonas sp. R2.Fl]MCL6714373.1 hypothetical protein [Pseudomonas sp. R2.Fl]